MRKLIGNHLSQFNLDVRITHDARFMDQKVTPDVLSFIADCILNYLGSDLDRRFTAKDIRESQYFINNVQRIFSKPSPENLAAVHEYDKFPNQPVKTLSYAHVLEENRHSREFSYKVINNSILTFIASNERFAYNFLYDYLTKVLSDSDFLSHIDTFEQLYREDRPVETAFHELKRKFQNFIIGNTSIRGEVEVNRIFPKIFNIFATERVMPGTVKGRLSQHIFYYGDLMYNRPNWRDVGKTKTITRQEAQELSQSEITEQHFIRQAKDFIRTKYLESELRDQWGIGPADHVHHIFPATQFPNLAEYIENLIKLTATQHLSKAHPSGNTHLVDLEYQKQCLLAKSLSIEDSITRQEFCYKKEFLIVVINTGYRINLNPALNMLDVRRQIQAYSA